MLAARRQNSGAHCSISWHAIRFQAGRRVMFAPQYAHEAMTATKRDGFDVCRRAGVPPLVDRAPIMSLGAIEISIGA
jgi:hypothetical protein